MYAVVRDGKITAVLPLNQSFTLDDYQYPANWLALSNSEHREALGIFPVTKDKIPSNRYMVVTENPPVWDQTRRCVQITYAAEPMALEQIQSREIEKIRQHGQTLLALSDKMVLAAHDHGMLIDQTWVAHRKDIHHEINRLVDGITNAKNHIDIVNCLSTANWATKP